MYAFKQLGAAVDIYGSIHGSNPCMHLEVWWDMDLPYNEEDHMRREASLQSIGTYDINLEAVYILLETWKKITLYHALNLVYEWMKQETNFFSVGDKLFLPQKHLHLMEVEKCIRKQSFPCVGNK